MNLNPNVVVMLEDYSVNGPSCKYFSQRHAERLGIHDPLDHDAGCTRSQINLPLEDTIYRDLTIVYSYEADDD
ncbi:hypothetical protein Mapa_017133 [Marchantia paleacea]|nr:hypothetical protein Mapa_017133 [Marchantia paleacea]